MLPGKTVTAALPTIHLANIGKDKGGATPAEVAEQVLVSISSNAARTASAALTKELGSLKGLTGGAGGDVGSQVKGLLGR